MSASDPVKATASAPVEAGRTNNSSVHPNKNANNGGGGLSLIDLRNLGSARTLVLVNWRRPPGGGAVDLNNIPLDDPETFKLLGEGKTAGVFQLEGTGMTRWLLQVLPLPKGPEAL